MSTPTKRALITGITGQDGSYLAELLLDKGYQVHGLIRRASNFNTGRIDHLYRDPHDPDARLFLHYGDLLDAAALAALIRNTRPDEIYNLAAQSHVRLSFDMPTYTADVVALGPLKLLEALRDYQQQSGSPVRFFQASSSEMFGTVGRTPQSETTPFHPCSPYGCAKLFAHWTTVNYRRAYNLHASCGILFNHESPRRGETFVTRKITRAAARIKLGLQDKLYLGNLDARRDWGFAADYVRAMWLILQQECPDDYVIATGRMLSVGEFCRRAFARLNLDYRDYVAVDPRYQRPTEVDELCGDASNARRRLGWTPQTSIDDLIALMVDHDLHLAQPHRNTSDADPNPRHPAVCQPITPIDSRNCAPAYP